MLAEQRQREILHRLAQAGAVRVGELARQFPVTEETIRRDLAKLDKEKKLRRTHGGAVSVASTEIDQPFEVRQTANLQAKQAIAREAIGFIEPGDVIALDSSSTAYEVARLIPDKPLTVITNAYEAAGELISRQQVAVYSTGGRLDRVGRCFLGSIAEQTLRHLSVNKLFFSCKGLDLERGLSEDHDEHARINQQLMGSAEQRFLLVDSSKFDLRALAFFARVEQMTTIITDADGASYAASLQGLGPRVRVAEPA